ncbi:MAG: hypothetical protein ACE5K8_04635 [Candidatus Zixiibacteriota bacterium]
MPIGFPDWFRPWSQFGGSSHRSRGELTLNQGATDTVLTVSGKGQLLGGYGYGYGVGVDQSDRFVLYVDGSIIFNFPFQTMLWRNLFYIHTSPLYLIQYDTTNGEFTVGISPYIPFLSSVQFDYSSGTSGPNTVLVEVELIYSTM